MIKPSITFLILILFFSCTSNDAKKNNNPPGKDTSNKNSLVKADTTSSGNTAYYKFTGDSVIIPSFEIEITLSPKAAEKIKNSKETIIVRADFTGQPKDTTSKEYAESGGIFLTSSQRELTESRIAKFEGIKFSKQLYDALADKDIQLLINVFTGRKSSKDNLLNCDILEDKMSNIKGRRFTLKGKLIYGDD